MSYHHWQIAYYTLKIGLKYGRMWDLSGLEYYWGILPELVESFLLWLFNTASMLPYRIFNAIIASISVLLAYRVVREHFEDHTLAIGTALLSSLWPTILVFNTFGLTETIGIFFLLLSLLAYRKRPYFCGVLLGLASMCRVEYWFIALGIIACYQVFERSGTNLVPAFAGWLTPMGPYLWHLGVQTGNPLYPLYWNFFGTVLGGWSAPTTMSTTTVIYRIVWLAIALLSVYLLLRLVRRKRSGYIVYILFLGYVALQGIVSVFSLNGDLVGVRYLMDRFMMLDYFFASLLLSQLFLRIHRIYAPKVRISTQVVYSIALLTIYLLAYTSFIPIYTEQGEMHYYFQVSDWLASNYQGGTILCNIPMMNYRLVDSGIAAQNITGTLYISHSDSTEALRWFKTHDVRWFVLTGYSYDDSSAFYNSLRSRTSLSFLTLKYTSGIIYIYFVNQTAIVA